jgi:hypothetical protein
VTGSIFRGEDESTNFDTENEFVQKCDSKVELPKLADAGIDSLLHGRALFTGRSVAAQFLQGHLPDDDFMPYVDEV